MKSWYWALYLSLTAAVTCTDCRKVSSDSDTTASSDDSSTADSVTESSSAADSGADSNSASSDSIATDSAASQTVSSIDAGEIGVTADEDNLNADYDDFDAEIVLDDDNTTITGDTSAVSFNGNQLMISAVGTYAITGALSDGQLLVTGEEKVKLYLNGVSITNESGAAMVCVNEKHTILSLADGTENTFTNDASNNAETIETHEIDPSAIYVQDKLTINGTDSLTVNGSCADGIICKDDCKLVGGTITVTAVDNGIKGKDCVALFGADLIIDAGNDGVKSTETTDAAKGFSQLDSGSAQITAGGDCFQAETLVRISSGTYTLKNSGTATDADTDESNSVKSVHCTGDITISGGTLTITAPEDGVNCGGALVMEDGTVTIDSEEDGVQADGNLTQLGGTLNITTTSEVSASSDGDDFGGGFGGGRQDAFGDGGRQDAFGGDMSADDIMSGDPNTASALSQDAAVTFVALTETETTTDKTDSASSKGVKCGGVITMSGNSYTVTSTDHAVHAIGDAVFDDATLLLNSSQKGISVHGNLTISDGEIVVETATESIESKSDLLVSGGTVRVLAASDDGINTGGTGNSHAMTFLGGYTYVCVVGDGIDSNATLDITGDTLIVCSPTSGADDSLDFETTMTYTGGTLLALSSNGMMEYADSGLLITTGASTSAGDLVNVVDADGNVLAVVKTPKAVTDVIFGIGDNSSDDYQILIGGSYSDTLNDDQYGTDGTITGGTTVDITTSAA